MKVGACGMACEVCIVRIKGKCDGCVSGKDESAPAFFEKLKSAGIACPVLQCAIERGVEHCIKDCERFPCDIHYQEFPYSKKFLDALKDTFESARK